MHWNHRVMKRERDGEVDFSIREVFYDDDETIETWTRTARRLTNYEKTSNEC